MNTPVMVRGACPHDCPDTCAPRITVGNGRAVRAYHPDRVLHPLRRAGPKGGGPGFHDGLVEVRPQAGA